MNFFKSMLFYILFYFGTICFFVFFSPVKWFSNNFVVYLSNLWTTSVIKLARFILGIDFKIIGRKNIPVKGPFLVASNHQSAWETFFFVSLFPGCVFILKDELKKIPIFSQYFKKLGFIYIKREKNFDSIKVILRSTKKLISQNKNIFIIFPEGTRIKPGTKSKLNTGVFAIHKFLKIPILPIKLNSGKYWLNKKFLNKSGLVKITIFPIIKNEINKNKLIRKLENYYYK